MWGLFWTHITLADKLAIWTLPHAVTCFLCYVCVLSAFVSHLFAHLITGTMYVVINKVRLITWIVVLSYSKDNNKNLNCKIIPSHRLNIYSFMFTSAVWFMATSCIDQQITWNTVLPVWVTCTKVWGWEHATCNIVGTPFSYGLYLDNIGLNEYLFNWKQIKHSCDALHKWRWFS